MHRFFVDPGYVVDNTIHFSPETSRQIARVLRLKTGTEVTVLDNSGKEYLSQLTDVDSNSSLAEILSVKQSSGEPKIELTMMLCLTQREKFEWMLQKCTEIGATRFVPVISSRSLVQQEQDVLDKFSRWELILKEAAEQSGRGRIPVLSNPIRINDAVKDVNSPDTLCLIPWEEEREEDLKHLLKKSAYREVVILIGPEGGFSSDEVKLAIREGFHSVSLGPRILRMETAAIFAASIVLYQLDPGG